MSQQCPVCANDLVAEPQEVFETGGWLFSCHNCGRFELAFESTVNLRNGALREPEDLALLSHKLQRACTATEAEQVSCQSDPVGSCRRFSHSEAG